MAEINPADNLNLLTPELQKAFQAASKAERRPIEQLETRQMKIQSRVDLLGDVLGRVQAVRDMMPETSTPLALRELAVSSTDEKIFTGTADKNIAMPGNHKIEILRLAKPASALSNAFPDRDSTRIGSGYFSFERADGETVNVYIDNDNATLDGVAQTINKAQVGMTASVIVDNADEDAPYKLLLQHSGTGSDNNVDYPTSYFVDPEEEFYLESESPAQNSIIRFEGFEMELPSNEVKDLVPGLTLNLKGTTEPGRPETLTLEQDIPKTNEKIKNVIEGLNKVLSFVQEQNKMDENTDTSKTLGGDYGIRLTETKIRDAISRQPRLTSNGTTISSVDIGIMYNKNGTIDFDEERFADALNKDYDKVVNYLTGDGVRTGVMTNLRKALEDIAGAGTGVLTVQQRNYRGQISELGKQIGSKEDNFKRKQQVLMAKLGQAQSALNSMKSQSSYLQGQMGGGMASLIGK